MHAKLFSVVSRILGVAIESVNADSSPETLPYWDSLKNINLILAIEEEFCISFQAEEISRMRNIRSIIEMLETKGIPENKA
jgi:acyl carrier protein